MSEGLAEQYQTSDIDIEDLILYNDSGNPTNLITFLAEIVIYEDIFSPCMTGEILLVDGQDLINKLPISGNEYIVCKFKTPTFEDSPSNVIEKTFQIYSIQNRVINSDKQSIYSLGFISVEGYQDQYTNVSKHFEGTTDEIVEQIYKDYIETDRRADFPGATSSLIVSDTPHTSRLSYISNYWTPFKNMAFISKRVRGSQLLGSDYLFFESNKSFYFVSIESLINDQTKNQALFDEYAYEMTPGQFPRRQTGSWTGNFLPAEATRITNITIPKTVDVLDGGASGYYANAIRGYDLTTKKLTESNFNYLDHFDKFVHTGLGAPIPEGVTGNPFTNTSYVTYCSGLFSDSGGSESSGAYGTTDDKALPENHPAQYITDRIHFRKSYLNSLDHMKFEITIPGRTDIQVGHCISIMYPTTASKPEDADADETLDRFLSGVYLITAIKHQIKFGDHVMKCEVIKNGVNLSYSEPNS